MSELRLSKFIADCGIASRRKAEELIADGRVTVNGKQIREQGIKINPIKDEVKVDGKLLELQKTKTYLAFHKPRGILSTMTDPEGRPCLGDFFDSREARLFHVGRLDKDSEGLILLINDCQWAQEMAHPSFEISKRYQVLLDRPLASSDFRKIRSGVELEDGMVKVKEASGQGRSVTLEIHEGRNQIIRRLMGELGYEVERLLRDRIGSISLGELPAGRWRHLNESETRTS